MMSHLEQAAHTIAGDPDDIGDDEVQLSIAHSLVSIATSLNKLANQRGRDR